METHFYVFTLKYQYFEKFFEGALLKLKFATNFSKQSYQAEHSSAAATAARHHPEPICLNCLNFTTNAKKDKKAKMKVAEKDKKVQKHTKINSMVLAYETISIPIKATKTC